jgi:hypothetical protein
MTQLFRIGGVYRNDAGVVVRIEEMPVAAQENCQRDFKMRIPFGWARAVEDNDPCGYVSLLCGRTVSAIYDSSPDIDGYDLIPGELHQVDGAWVPITEQPMSVYFADAQEEEDPLDAENVQRYLAAHGITAYNVRVQRIDPNAKMIARDGPAAPKPAVVALPAAPTAHPAIAGLLVVGAVDHRLGSAFR